MLQGWDYVRASINRSSQRPAGHYQCFVIYTSNHSCTHNYYLYGKRLSVVCLEGFLFQENQQLVFWRYLLDYYHYSWKLINHPVIIKLCQGYGNNSNTQYNYLLESVYSDTLFFISACVILYIQLKHISRSIFARNLFMFFLQRAFFKFIFCQFFYYSVVFSALRY